MTYSQLKTHGVLFGKIYVNMNLIQYIMSKKNIDTWKSFTEEKCVKMIDSVPRRLEAIIRKKRQCIMKRDY